MDRDNRLRAAGDGAFQENRVQRVGSFVNIDKYRLRSAEADRLRRSHEGHRSGDHFIPGADPECQQAQPKRIRSVADPNGIRSPAKRSEVLLKSRTESTAGNSAAD